MDVGVCCLYGFKFAVAWVVAVTVPVSSEWPVALLSCFFFKTFFIIGQFFPKRKEIFN